MAQRGNKDITTEEFRELMKEINKRMILVGLGAIALGLVIIGLMYLLGGN
ncbi:hypothetical protein ACN082_01510 [Rothia sp. CCM 9417]